MKYLSLLFVLAFMACSSEKSLKVAVKNTTDLNRTDETVEVCWKEVTANLPGATKENVVVTDAQGQEIPSQVIFNGGTEPVAVIFQANVQPNAEAAYQLKLDQPAAYPQKAYGRIVPERMDDFAWENNIVAHRMYGPALEATGEISNGIDVWVKRTDELLIDVWYKTGDYHKDHGKGMDCYKVGRTLGAGAMAPYVDGKLVLGNNFTKAQVLDNGPLRISFKLDYAPYKVGENEVNESRVISLDANSRFNKIQEIYRNAPASMEVAAGIVTRPEPSDTLMDAAAGLIGYWEPQNNDNKMNNGHVALGLVFPQGAKAVMDKDGHLLALSDYKQGEPFVYYLGTGWSKGGLESAAAWFEMIKNEKVKVNNPLVVTVVENQK